MNKPLEDTPLIELIPSSISDDQTVRDMADAVQPELDDVTTSIPFIELYRRIDELPEDVLRMLAWENRVYGAEWALARTIEDKRALVKGSFELNNRRGTRWAVERIFELLRLRAEIAEWFEEGGDPATFRIVILDVSGRGIEEHELALLDELIELYKPLTRHNLGINLGVEISAEVYGHGAVSIVAAYEIGLP